MRNNAAIPHTVAHKDGLTFRWMLARETEELDRRNPANSA